MCEILHNPFRKSDLVGARVTIELDPVAETPLASSDRRARPYRWGTPVHKGTILDLLGVESTDPRIIDLFEAPQTVSSSPRGLGARHLL